MLFSGNKTACKLTYSSFTHNITTVAATDYVGNEVTTGHTSQTNRKRYKGITYGQNLTTASPTSTRVITVPYRGENDALHFDRKGDTPLTMDFDAVVAHLKNSFGRTQHRDIARQALSTCQQQIGGSAWAFANRLLTLVRAVTTGHYTVSQKERMLEQFIARLRPDVRYYVKFYNPSTFEQAVSKAQVVEQLLAEALTDRLIHPASSYVQ